MPGLSLEGFSGIVPRTGPSLLADNQAVEAKNVKLHSGELRPWRKPLKVYEPDSSSTASIYRLYSPAGDSVWLEWDTDVDVVSSPAADTADGRVYYTGDGGPKKTNWDLATTSGGGSKPFPNAYMEMGVPAPAAAPTVASASGTGTQETRVYVYTYVSEFGSVEEESAPSPPSQELAAYLNGTVNVSGFSVAPTNADGYNITKIRIYRTVVGSAEVVYQLVDEIYVEPSTGQVQPGNSLNGVAYTSTYPDSRSVTQLGKSLDTLDYGEPPADLKGLVSMGNGILAGFRGNEVWFSEPYRPHAWPAKYVMTVDSQIVGLGVFGQSLFVGTERNPYLITGTTPGGMSQERLPIEEPCVSKRSIVGDKFGVMYASPNGLVAVGPGSLGVVTKNLMTRDEWQQRYPQTIIAALYDDMYVGFHTSGSGKGVMVLQRTDNPPLTTMDFSADAVHVDVKEASLYALSANDGAIYQIDGDTVNNTVFEWMSKEFILPYPTNFAAMKAQLDFAFINDGEAYNQAVEAVREENEDIWNNSSGSLGGDLNAALLNIYTVNGSDLVDIPRIADLRSVTIIVYGDGEVVFAGDIQSPDPIRMPADTKRYKYQFKITGNAPVKFVKVATTMQELRAL